MPEATFLQIQGREGSTMRMLELPPGPVRIGRGPLCEVRLSDPDLGDVQCMLRRRGETWHFQPVGPPGHVWFDGRPADQQRPLRSGVPFRVGDHWLTLRSAESATNDWGSFAAPITVEPETEATITPSPEAEPVPTNDIDPPPFGPSPDAKDERLRRWQARLDQRDRWLKDRQDERRWEARWKAAGETIRARAAQTPPSSPPPSRPTPPPTPTPTPRPPQAPPIARIIEPRPSEPLRRIADPTRRPTAPRVPIRTGPEPTIASPIVRVPLKTARTVEPPTPQPEPRPTTRALVALPAPMVDWSAALVEPAEKIAPPLPLASEEPEARITAPEPAVEVEPELEIADAPEVPASLLDESPILDEGSALVVEAEPEPPVEPEAATIAEVPPEVLPVPIWPTEPEPEPEPVTATVAPVPIEEEARDARPFDSAPRGGAAEAARSNADWPSAQAIFAAQGRRPNRAPEPSKAQVRRRRSVEPEPTDALAPAQWTLSLWLGLFPATVIALVLGVGGIALSREWVLDANAADFAIRAALRPEGSPSPTIDPASLPRGGWWQSTAPHLAAWAVALERSGDGEDHSEEIRALVEAARHASPLSSGTRFVLESTAGAETGALPDLSYLGRSRDVVSMVWTGRRLHKEGKAEASLRAYRSALEMAARAGRDDLDLPIFDDDPQVRRYPLPRESLLGWVARDMAQAGGWTHEQWAEALPPSAAASLAAARVLARKQDRAEADRLADLAIRQADSPPPPGFDPAEHRAAVAEALAYRGRWTDAAEQYRLAIDLVEDDATRRMWWLNLAEVAQRTGDDTLRSRALEAAKAPDSSDKITQRALKYQQGLPGLAPSGPRR